MRARQYPQTFFTDDKEVSRPESCTVGEASEHTAYSERWIDQLLEGDNADGHGALAFSSLG